jgi:hypothetical protein
MATPVPDNEVDGVEGWVRAGGEFELVEAVRHPAGFWHVAVAAMEFVRSEPLESELRAAIAVALGAVPGVETVDEDDREVWLVTGEVSGEGLVDAVAGVIDGRADALARHLDSL